MIPQILSYILTLESIFSDEGFQIQQKLNLFKVFINTATMKMHFKCINTLETVTNEINFHLNFHMQFNNRTT